MKQRRLRQLEREEERRVDSILVRVKELGLDAISPEERALLQRVSARYRDRQRS
jgi:2-oxo-4-hydroxy-4-carboxy--5-ureidoimidazoline (OHCU) decarboxylase